MLIDRLIRLLEDPGAQGGGSALPDLLLRGVSTLGKDPVGSTCLHNQPGTVRPLRFLPGQEQYEMEAKKVKYLLNAKRPAIRRTGTCSRL